MSQKKHPRDIGHRLDFEIEIVLLPKIICLAEFSAIGANQLQSGKFALPSFVQGIFPRADLAPLPDFAQGSLPA